MSCGSSPKFTNSTIAGPVATVRRESAYQNSLPETWTRVTLIGPLAACAGTTASPATATSAASAASLTSAGSGA